MNAISPALIVGCAAGILASTGYFPQPRGLPSQGAFCAEVRVSYAKHQLRDGAARTQQLVLGGRGCQHGPLFRSEVELVPVPVGHPDGKISKAEDKAVRDVQETKGSAGSM
jgi:hypothetical protein